MRTRAATSLALVLAAIVGVSLVWVSASGADTYLPQDPQYNNVSYWQSQGYQYCVKYEPVATPYTVPAPAGGGGWDLMIIKAGAGDDANQLVSAPTVGGSYGHSSGKDISHIILCVVQTPTTTTSTSTSTSTSSTSSTSTSSTTTTTSTTVPTSTSSTASTTTSTTVPTTSTSQPEVSGSTTIATTTVPSTTVPSTTVPSTTVPASTTTTPEVLGTTTIVGGSTTVPTTVPADVLGTTTIVTPAPSSGGSTSGGSTQSLATTGAFHGDWFAAGALVLLSGLALMWLERRSLGRQR